MTHAPDPELPWVENVLLRVEVGSTAHGTGLEGVEDYDELGVMAIPWEYSIGVPVRPDNRDTIVYRPGRAVGERSQADDYDLQVHSARKFASLAAQGNPSVLMVFFGPLRYSNPNGLGDELRALAPAFWSQQARARFLGYAKAQRERLLGERGGKHTNRPELVDIHGYDTKYAMHMLRLGYQGLEYMTTGEITLPCVGAVRQLLIDVRHGQFDRGFIVNLSLQLEEHLASLPSKAPERADLDRINAWLLRVFDWKRSVSASATPPHPPA